MTSHRSERARAYQKEHPYAFVRNRKPRVPKIKYYNHKVVTFGDTLDRVIISTSPVGQSVSRLSSAYSLGPKDESRSGYPVPSWKEKITDQLDASSGYQRVSYGIEYSPGDYTYQWYDKVLKQRSITRTTGPLFQFSNWPGSSGLANAALEGEAVTKFLAKCYQKQTTFSGGIFLGELREAIHMIRHPLDGLYNGFFKYLKTLRGRKVRFKKGVAYRQRIAILNNIVANTWLEFQYGWRPLVSDLEGAAEALSFLTQRSPIEHVGAKAMRESYSRGTQQLTVLDSLYSNLRYYDTTVSRATVKIVGGMHALVDSVKGLNLGDVGLGLKDFAPTVWELIPYSFLVDYFANVGELVQAQSAVTTGIYYCTKTVVDESRRFPTDITVTDNIGPYGSGNVVREIAGGDFGQLTLSFRAYNRYVVAPGDLIRSASLRFYTPLLGSLRSYNVAALLAQSKRTSNLLLHR